MVLRIDQVEACRQFLYGRGSGKQHLKGMTFLPSRPDMKAAFEAIDDAWESGRLGIKAAVDASLGRVTTDALAKEFMKAWMEFKLGEGG